MVWSGVVVVWSGCGVVCGVHVANRKSLAYTPCAVNPAVLLLLLLTVVQLGRTSCSSRHIPGSHSRCPALKLGPQETHLTRQ